MYMTYVHIYLYLSINQSINHVYPQTITKKDTRNPAQKEINIYNLEEDWIVY